MTNDNMKPLKTKGPDGQKWLGELRVLRQINEYEFEVLLRVMRNGYIKSNNWEFKDIDKYYLTFLGTPILCAYVNGEIGDGHNMRETRDRKGKYYQTFTDDTAERIVGMLSDDENDLRLIDEGGYTWLEAKGKLWSFYAHELVEKIVRTGRMDVSAETEIKRGETVENGKEIFYEWTGLGVTVLGDRVNPAIPGAGIKKLSEMGQEFRQAKLRAASLEGIKDPSATKPQAKTQHKGVKTKMDKRLKAELEGKFPGYCVLAASEDGMNVALMSEKGAYQYSFNAEDAGAVVESRIQPVCLSAEYDFGEESKLTVSVDDMLDSASRKVASLSAELATANSEKEALAVKLANMETAEQKRRLAAAKGAVEKTIAALNASRQSEEHFDISLCSALIADIEAGKYANLCNEAGEWTGESAVEKEVKALCMDAQHDMDAKHQTVIHSAFNMAGRNDGGIQSVIDRVVNRK